MQYWLLNDDQVLGPYELQEVQGMIDRGSIQRGNMLSRGEGRAWELAGSQPEWSWPESVTKEEPTAPASGRAGAAIIGLILPPVAAIFGLMRLAEGGEKNRAEGFYLLCWAAIGVLFCWAVWAWLPPFSW